MRKNRIKLTLIIASLCGAGSSANALGQDYSNSGPISSVGRIGDGGVRDTATEDALGQDARPAAFRSNVVSDNGMDSTISDNPMSYASYDSSLMGSTEYVGSSPTSSSRPASYATVGSSGPLGWFESETLLWWPRSVAGGPLVLGGGNPTVRPSIPLAGGPDNPIGNELLVGMRYNLGVWADNDQNLGLGARAWGILSDGSTKTYTNGGNSTGLSFFNTSVGFGTPAEDVYLVNVSAGGLGANTGTIQIKNDLDLVAGELYGRALLIRDGKSRVDLLGGYTFTRLDSEFGIRSQFTDGISGNGILNGTVATRQDTFGTKNEFHGGHIGLSNEVSKGRFTFSTLGKVAIGNMRQTSTISGRTTIVTPSQPLFSEERGLFSQPSNIGTISRDRFTFLPEAGAKMKYQLGRAQLGVGYTLLMFPSVAMAGSQLDRNVDLNPTVPGQPIAPAARLVSDTFFLHGLDLGMSFSF